MGSLTINGATSGQITLTSPAVAGTNTLTLPAATGTVLTTAGGQNVNSSIGINGATSGTITLAVPSVAGTNTITLAAQTGTLNVAGPAFSAYASASQTVTTTTQTKVAIDTENFDTNNNFDTTNNRFTPTVAGYYQVNGSLRGSGTATFTSIAGYIYKNGSPYKRAQITASLTAGNNTSITVSDIIYMNGSTDYLELWGNINGTGTLTFTSTNSTDQTSYFSAALVRGA